MLFIVKLITSSPKLDIHNSFRLIAALALLAALLVAAPGQARAAGAALCSAAPAGTNRAPRAQAGEAHQAGLVIDFGDGRVMSFCIDLGDDGQATGEEVLRASNLPVIIEYSGNGGAVCKIDTVGSNFPSEPCFSHCTLRPGETCMYWSYSLLVGDHWQFSQIGASNVVVHSGDVNGWAWGESTIAHGAQPPLRTLAEICLPATPTPTASPTLTPTATQPPAVPPPATATPYVARVITATPTVSATPTSAPTTTPVVTPPTPTSTPTQAGAPTTLPVASPTASPQPTVTLSATALPTPTSTPQVDTSVAILPAPAAADRGTEGSLRIQLPLIQHLDAATPSATTRPTAQVEAQATPFSPTPTPSPRQAAPEGDPTGTYPYFGGTAALLLAIWALLRRGRRSP
jgi:hypothetical protein